MGQLSSLMATYSDPVNKDDSVKKIIIHGNFKTLNNELMLKLGIMSINGELTTRNRPDGTPFLRILVPEYTEEEKQKFKKENENDNMFLFQDMIGHADHVYFNENLHDSIQNINPALSQMKLAGGRNRFFISIKQQRYIFDRILEGGEPRYYIRLLTDTELKRAKQVNQKWVVLNGNDVVEGSSYVLKFKLSMRKIFQKNLLWFDSAYTRENFLQQIKK